MAEFPPPVGQINSGAVIGLQPSTTPLYYNSKPVSQMRATELYMYYYEDVNMGNCLDKSTGFLAPAGGGVIGNNLNGLMARLADGRSSTKDDWQDGLYIRTALNLPPSNI